MKGRATGKTGITYPENSGGRTKLPEVILSLIRLLFKNADRQAALTGHGFKLTPRAGSPMRQMIRHCNYNYFYKQISTFSKAHFSKGCSHSRA